MFPLPYSVSNPTRKLPFVVFCLIALNFAIHIGGAHGGDLPYLYEKFGFLISEMRLTTLITHQFLHGGWMHLVGNMLYLWLFGANLEDLMGKAGFIVFYLVGGMVACLIFKVAQDLVGAPPVPLIGASGAISAVMGGYFVLFPKSRVNTVLMILFFPIPFIPLPAWVFLGFYMVMQFVSMRMMEYSGVAYMAHVGGFAFGAGILYLLIATRAVIVPHLDVVRRGELAYLGPQEEFLGRLDAAYEKKHFGNVPKLYRELLEAIPDVMFEPDQQMRIARAIFDGKDQYLAVVAYRRLMQYFPEHPLAQRAGVEAAKILAISFRDTIAARAYLNWVLKASGGQGAFAAEAKSMAQRLQA